MHACRYIHETRRVGLYIKGVSHGFVQMVYYCLDLAVQIILSNEQQNGRVIGRTSDVFIKNVALFLEVLLVLVIPALSFIALLNDARKCLVSVYLTRADF
jgi:hypothetical protein